jgi:hypothetical protein
MGETDARYCLQIKFETQPVQKRVKIIIKTGYSRQLRMQKPFEAKIGKGEAMRICDFFALALKGPWPGRKNTTNFLNGMSIYLSWI